MTVTFSNTPSPEALLMTARESLKQLLHEPGDDHAYTILMAMNAMGIAARAMQADAPPPAHAQMSDETFKCWVREADESAILDKSLVAGLRRHVDQKLAVSNPRFKPESPKSQP